MGSGLLLQRLLRPLAPWLEQPKVREICCNEPGAIWVECQGQRGMTRHAVPELTAEHLAHLARQVAVSTAQVVSEQQPLLGGRLPGGERIQCVLPPVSHAGAFAIRRQVVRALTPEDYVCSGAFAHTHRSCSVGSLAQGAAGPRISAQEEAVRKAFATGPMEVFLGEAVRGRKNLLISGAPGTGKTAFLQMLARAYIAPEERLVVIEDTRELELAQPNVLYLLVSKGDQGEARVDVAALLEAALRMRPDRILLGELRGAEAYTYLRAINFGRRGSLATLHADSPAQALEQLGLMVLQAGLGLQLPDIRAYVRPLIDGIVQLEQDAVGAHLVAEVQYADG